jgi:hypothetical protein
VYSVVKYVSPPRGTTGIEEDAYGALLRFRSLADLMGGVPQYTDVDTQLREELLATISDELATADKALKSKAWHVAMVDELESIKENKT